MFMSECSSLRNLGTVCVVSIISCIQNKLIRVHTVPIDASEKKKEKKNNVCFVCVQHIKSFLNLDIKFHKTYVKQYFLFDMSCLFYNNCLYNNSLYAAALINEL